MRRMLLALMLISVLVMGASAQDEWTEGDVIAIVIEQYPFNTGLQNVSDWSAAAYDTGSSYGIWRVQFWNGSGEEIGWADVNPDIGKIYVWEAYFGATESQKQDAYPILREVINNDATVLELLEAPDLYELYVDFQWDGTWGVYLANGLDSLWIIVETDNRQPDSLENPRVKQVYFSELMSYSEWYEAAKAQAITLAYQQEDVAAAVRGINDWRADAEKIAPSTWRVVFMQADNVLTEATVNLDDASVSLGAQDE